MRAAERDRRGIVNVGVVVVVVVVGLFFPS
jgi:hypothetical protein